MKPNDSKLTIGFTKPAVYKIKVLGELNKKFSGKLSGMQVFINRESDGKTISVLVGQINDQAALSGILNALYEMQFTILSLNVMEDL
jgi:hypothetical protein